MAVRFSDAHLYNIRITDGKIDRHGDTGCWGRTFPNGFFHEFKSVFRIGVPIILIQLCQMILGPMALVFCGHLGKVELDAVALSNSIINVTVISAVEGLGTACDTLFSQVYGSANRHKLGLCVQRSVMILTLVVLPIWAIHLNTGNILVLLGQDKDVVRLTDRYMLLFMPGTFFFFAYISCAKYMQTQNIVYPNLVIGIITNLINAGAHYFFVYYLDLGTNGSALSLDLSYLCMLLGTVFYIIKSKSYEETWEGFGWDNLLEWGVFAKLAVFGLFMICFEWWSFEICIFVAGVLGQTELGAMSLIYQFEEVWYMFPYGTSVATSIRVGQYLGAGDKWNARAVGWVAMISMSIVSIFTAIFFVVLRNYLPYIFTSDSDVLALSSTILPVLAAFSLVDTLSGVGAGILRGCGKQWLGTVIIGIGYSSALAIGIPVMFATGKGIIVLWGALVSAVGAEALAFLFFIFITDWDQEVVLAAERTHTEDLIRKQLKRRFSTVLPDNLEDLLIESASDDEKAPLMASDTSMGYSATDNATYAVKTKQPIKENEGRKYLCTRLLVAAAFFAVFGVGLVARMVSPSLWLQKDDVNCTMPGNNTNTTVSIPWCDLLPATLLNESTTVSALLP